MPIAPLILSALLAPQATFADQPSGGLSLLSVAGPAGARCEVAQAGKALAPLPVPGTVTPPEGVTVTVTCTLPGGSAWSQALAVPPGVHRRIRLAAGARPSSDGVGLPADELAALLSGLAGDGDRRARQIRLLALPAEARLTVDQLDAVLGALPLPTERRWAATRFGPGLVDPGEAGRLARRFALAGDRAWWVQAQAGWAQRTE